MAKTSVYEGLLFFVNYSEKNYTHIFVESSAKKFLEILWKAVQKGHKHPEVVENVLQLFKIFGKSPVLRIVNSHVHVAL